MGTAGRRAEGYGGSWVYYEDGRGLGTLMPSLAGRDSIAVGNFVFSTDALRRRPMLYWHEYRHYQQSTDRGFLFLPEYLHQLVVYGYEDNAFERDADRWAWRLRRTRVV